MGIGSTQVKQICICTWDIKKAEETWTNILGIEPRHAITPDYSNLPSFTNGIPDKIGGIPFIVYELDGGLSLEIFGPGDKPNPWRAFLEKHGEGVMNLGFFVPDREAAYKAIGRQPYHEGFYDGGTYSLVNTMDGACAELNIKAEENNDEVIRRYVEDPAAYNRK